MLLVLPCRFARASLIINEIMYDLSGADSISSKSREWVEIRNPDGIDVSIDASTWRIYDGSANRTINGEVNFTIPAGGYVIFAGDKDTFLTDHSGFSGTVYDTGITTLNNTGANLKLLDQDGNIVDAVTYASSQGGAGDGNSLQKISGAWSGATPTSGVANEAETPPSPSGNGSGSTGGGEAENDSPPVNATENKTKPSEVKKIKTQIINKTLAFTGNPIYFQAISYGQSGEQLLSGKYFWNFGDGDSREVKLGMEEKFAHVYIYPGEYIVSLEYYINNNSGIPDATDKINLKIVSADLIISRVGEEKDFFIELANNANYDMDISKWILAGDNKSFIFPKNTILASKKKVTFSPKITNFSIADKNNLKLLNPQGELIFDYLSYITPATPVKNSIPPKISSPVFSPAIQAPEEIPVLDKQIRVENLPARLNDVSRLGGQASVIQSDISEDSSANPYTMVIPLASIIFIGASAGAVYFIRQKRVIPGVGNDFEILDE